VEQHKYTTTVLVRIVGPRDLTSDQTNIDC